VFLLLICSIWDIFSKIFLIIMPKLSILILLIIFYNSSAISMEKKPYHHLPDGTFRNPEGSPVR